MGQEILSRAICMRREVLHSNAKLPASYMTNKPMAMRTSGAMRSP